MSGHRRSLRSDTMRPCGRTSSIAITPVGERVAVVAQLERQVAWSATVMIPRRRPPSTAPGRLPVPPRIVATNATSTALRPIVGVTTPVWATSRIAAAAASTPLIANAVAITRFAFTPSSAGHAEVLGRGAHLDADLGPAEERDQRRRRAPP